MSALQAVAVVAMGTAGAACVLSTLPVSRRRPLAARLRPYLGALGPRRSALLDDAGPQGALDAFLGPAVEAMGSHLQRMLGDHGDLRARLGAAALEWTPARFRARQVTFALGGFTVGVAAAVLIAGVGRAFSPVGALGTGIACGVGGVWWLDHSLTRAIERRRARMTAEFPTFVDMVCLAVTAGESLRGALDLVTHDAAGELAREVRGVLREARTGVALIDALEHRARVLGLPPFERLVGSIAASQERGIPLADSLRAMAFDVREGEKRAVIEAAGRKQVSMLVPVVGLILPVAIAFAFFPGLVAVRTLVR
jgi:tight adherence protein C